MTQRRDSLFLRGGIFIIAPAVMLVLCWPGKASAEITADHLVISEVQTGLSGSGNSQKDFIELYNPTSQDVDLDGYRLVKRTKTGTSDTTIKSWTSSTVIPSKSFYLWANSNYSEITGLADTTTSQSIADDNAVALRMGPEDTGLIIDAVAWGENSSGLAEGASFPQNVPDDQSLERLSDTDNNAADFTLQTTPSPGQSSLPPNGNTSPTDPTDNPPAAPTAPDSSGGGAVVPRVDVVVTELMPNPDGADSGREWVEIHNPGSNDADISGWILDDQGLFLPGSGAYALPQGSVVPAQSYTVFLIPKGNFALNNDTDVLRFFDDTEALLQQVSYIVGGKEGQSYARTPSGSWYWTDTPTPGAENIISIPQPAAPKTSEPKLPARDLYKNFNVVFNEVFGNPEGADAGQEWLELKNLSSAEADLSGWHIDDAGTTVSSNAYLLPSGSLLKPGGLLLVRLPESSSFITNTQETLRLISPDKQNRSEVILPAMLEGQSFARLTDTDQWDYSYLPTPGEENKFISLPQDVVLSEIYFKPAEDDEDFLELFNHEEAWVNLSGWRLELGENQYVFPDGASIPARSYLLLSGQLINVRVNDDNWRQLKLVRPDGPVQYEIPEISEAGDKLSAGQSLAASRGKVSVTDYPTPGRANKIGKLPKASAEKTPVAAVPSTQSVLGVKSTSAPAASNTLDISSGVIIELGSSPNAAGAPELPIVIEKEEKRGFFHRLRGFFCRVSFNLVKCR